MTNEKSTSVEVRNVELASYLITLGFKFIRPVKKSHRVVVFLFPQSEKLEETCLRFFNHEGKLDDALTYAETLRNVYRMTKNLSEGEVSW